MFKNKIAFIAATKDRPRELRRMLKSIDSQSIKPDQIIVVDGGKEQVKKVTDEFAVLKIRYIRCIPPSAAKQRNVGLKLVNPEITLVGFFDDDIVLKPDAIERMMEFWENALQTLGGASFNLINHPKLYASFLKSLPLTKKLGLYSSEGGVILSSGFQTLIGFVSENSYVQWLPTTASVWRRGLFDEYKFDEWFKGYSYLEDLDFSYRIRKFYRLMVVEDARYYHFSNSLEKGNPFKFGVKEVENRLYFVKKYKELSVIRCYISLILRIIINLSFFIKQRNFRFFQQVCGNATGIIKHMFQGVVK